jgi:2-polyprenyl-3-methyl-5-hydroxy-6-metoxy-1,4-benzoquinol methylase
MCGAIAHETQRRLTATHVLLRCRQCGCRFCNPFEAPPPEFYEKATDHASTARHETVRDMAPNHPVFHTPLLKHATGHRVLELGCGNGAFLKLASERGCQVTGLDLDAVSLEAARARRIPGCELFRQTLAEFSRQQAEKSFDIIAMFEVFEHLDEPAATLTLIRTLLRDGGYFIGSVPNIERLFMWCINWDYELPPYHLTYWTQQSLQHQLERWKFRVLRCEPSIYYGYVCDNLAQRFRRYDLISRFIANVLYRFEYKFELLTKRAAGLYFEAQL